VFCLIKTPQITNSGFLKTIVSLLELLIIIELSWSILMVSGLCSQLVRLNNQFAITERRWAKYRDLSVVSRSVICQSWRLRQIIDLQGIDKSQYFTTTEVNKMFYHSIIVLLINKRHWITLSQFEETICHFHTRVWFQLCMSRILFAVEHFIFVGHYLQVMWWALSQWKRRKKYIEW